MKTIKPQHNLAVLRKRLKVGQKQVADWAECSASMIQSIELRRAKLPREMACKISFQTGVKLSWLTSNKVNFNPVDDEGMPYTLETYRTRKKLLKDANGLQPATHMLSGLVADLLAESQKRGVLATTCIELALALRKLTVKFNEMSNGSLETNWERRRTSPQNPFPKIKIEWSATGRSDDDAVNTHVGQVPHRVSRLRRTKSEK